MRWPQLFLLVAIGLWSVSMWGQTTYLLTGTVTDTQGQVLPGAAVLVQEDLRLGVTADNQGQYTIEFPSAGPWTVSASFVGHNRETVSIVFSKAP